MEKKSDLVRQYVKAGDYRRALSITKGFRLGISRDQHAAMVRAHECFSNPEYYRSIGRNPSEEIRKGIAVLKGLYGERVS